MKGIFEKIIQMRCQEKALTLKPITKLGIDEVHLEVLDDSPALSPPTADSSALPLAASLAETVEKIRRV